MNTRLGSAREARDWYYKGRHILEANVVEHRIGILAQIIRLLLTMIPQQRSVSLRESAVTYEIDPTHLLENVPFSW